MTESIKKCILLVEDEPLLAMAEKIQLEKYGYTVRTVTTGEKAVETANSATDIDLILMDINLGKGIDGTRAAQIILKDHDIPIVFLSSHTEPEIVEKTEKISSYGYVVKNSSITVLDASIKMAFRLFEATKKAQDREEHTRYILKHNPNAIAVFDNEMNLLLVSDRFLEDYKLERKDIIGKNHYEVFPDIPERWREIHKRALRGEVLRNEDDFFVRTDGSVTYARWECRPWYNSDKTIGGMIAYTEVITERKRAEEALRASENKLRQVIDLVPQFIFAKDVHGTYLMANKTFAEAYGTTPEELVGKSDYDFTSNTEETAFFLECDRKVIESGTGIYNLVEPFTDSAGTRRYVETTKIPFTTSGAGVPAILAVSSDVTDQKMLHKSLELQSEILQHIGQAVIATDLQGEVFYWNQKAETDYGWSPKEAIGKNILELTPTEQTREQAAEIMTKLTQGQKWNGEFTVQRKDGSSFPAYVTNTPILDDKGSLNGIIGISTDITERKHAEDEIQKQLSEKDILLREVHHRVKNNIATIEGLLSLQIEDSDSLDVKVALQEAITRVQSIRVLYDKLLISKEYDGISMRTYVKSLLDSLIMVFDPGKTITVETLIADFQIDGKKAISIGIIINELMTNVFKYAFKDRDHGIVSVSIEKEKKEVTLIVQDNGVGIDETDLENKSPGFGLTIVRMLAEQLDGTYRIVNENGTKSMVKFSP